MSHCPTEACKRKKSFGLQKILIEKKFPTHPIYLMHVLIEGVPLRLQAKYSRLRLFNLGEMSCFNQHNAVQ